MKVFIVNSQAGNGNSITMWRKIERKLQEKGSTYQAFITSSKEDLHAIFQTVSSLPHVTGVFVLGGDGTVNHVLPFVIALDLPIGVIPAGSGNDIARVFHIPKRIDQIIAYIEQPKQRGIDVMQVNQSYSLSVVGVGLDAAIAHHVDQAAYKKLFNAMKLGSIAYILSLLILVTQYQRTKVTIYIDGQKHVYERVWLIACGNTPYYGGGMKICPTANGNDGILDVCVFKNVPVYKLFSVLPAVFSGKHVEQAEVELLRGRRIEIETPVPLRAVADGESVGATPVRITVLPNRLQCLVYNK